MRRVGNKVGNEYWEARLPPEFMRPNSCDRASMEAFIRAKYAEGRWAGPGTPPHLRTGRGGGPGAGGAPRTVANMYDGYFAHNVNQQQPQQRATIMGGAMPNRHLIGSKSVEFGRKPVPHEAPVGPREMHKVGMGLSEFMKGLDKKEEEVVDLSGEDGKNMAPPSTDDSSSFDFMKGDGEQEAGAEGEAHAEPAPVAVEPKPEVEVKRNPVPIAKPGAEKHVDFSNATGSTAMEIMMGQGQPAAAGPKKQRLFQKKKGASRFAKKAGAPKAGGNVIDQMLDFSQEARYRPVSAPVVQGGPAASQVGYYGAPQQGYGYGAPQQGYGYGAPQQQQSPYGRPQLNHFVPNAHQQRQYEQYQQQLQQQQQEQQYQSEYGPLAYPDSSTHRTSF